MECSARIHSIRGQIAQMYLHWRAQRQQRFLQDSNWFLGQGPVVLVRYSFAPARHGQKRKQKQTTNFQTDIWSQIHISLVGAEPFGAKLKCSFAPKGHVGCLGYRHGTWNGFGLAPGEVVELNKEYKAGGCGMGAAQRRNHKMEPDPSSCPFGFGFTFPFLRASITTGHIVAFAGGLKQMEPDR